MMQEQMDRLWGEGQEVRKAVWRRNASRQGKLIASGDPMQRTFGREVTCSALWEHRCECLVLSKELGA